ncbi:hypothetical protein [Bifidobacterium aesculapii]|uniref:hypothetical protein n=1 Tax=Bifidobacterium aesculapii TaxID=1329411 RepID=UPI0006E26F6E|nr:hypothetical protein [Bifidobacterium aesculapii]
MTQAVITRSTDGAQGPSGESWTERFRRDVDRRYVSDDQVDRAARLIDEIARMAVARGMSLEPPSDRLFERAQEAKWPWPHIVVKDGEGFLRSFHVAELSKPGTAPKPRRLSGEPQNGIPMWIAGRSRQFEPTGALSLRVDGDMPRTGQRSMRDTVHSRIEERLGVLFETMADDTRLAREYAEAERRREVTVEQAQRACLVDRLYTALCDEVRAHEELRRQRCYLDEVEQRLRRTDPDRLLVVADDIEMMREHIDKRDPLTGGGVAWCTQPAPTDVDVYEYMRRNRQATAGGRDGGCAGDPYPGAPYPDGMYSSGTYSDDGFPAYGNRPQPHISPTIDDDGFFD